MAARAADAPAKVRSQMTLNFGSVDSHEKDTQTSDFGRALFLENYGTQIDDVGNDFITNSSFMITGAMISVLHLSA